MEKVTISVQVPADINRQIEDACARVQLKTNIKVSKSAWVRRAIERTLELIAAGSGE